MVAEPPPHHVLERGDYESPGEEVRPDVPAVLTRAENRYAIAARSTDSGTTGRRLAFARWLTQPGHPLTARVMVNRLWQHHFGEGLSRTPDNFGMMGSAPTPNPQATK